MSDKKYVTFERHEDDEWYDEVRVRCVERWKESELSGDEWRFSYVVEALRKGQVIVRKSFSRLPWALAHVPAITLIDDIPDEFKDSPVVSRWEEFCFQPGCPEAATREFRIVQRWEHGYKAYMGAESDYRMRFCAKHGGGRGDCGLEDADDNLVEVEFGSAADAPALGGDPR